MIYVFSVALLYCIGTGMLDAYFSARGIAAGKFIEGNEWLTGMMGTVRPSFREIVGFNMVITTVLSICAVFGIIYGNNPLMFLSASCLGSWGTKHILGAVKARRMGR